MSNELWKPPQHGQSEPPQYGQPEPPLRGQAKPPLRWRTQLILFVLTVASVFWAGTLWEDPAAEPPLLIPGASFAVPLMAILLAHEFGHYTAARLHGIPASLPYFLPLPFLSPFGTMGAVILVSERTRKRDALLDFGAAGPLAGLVVAIPMMVVGLNLSTFGPLPRTGLVIQEGQSILYWALKFAVFGPMPAGYDVNLHPTALAAWVGFLVTFLNLLPFSQLDGGHVAYALLGERQNRFARYVFFFPLALLIYNGVTFGIPFLRGDEGVSGQTFVGATLTWLVIFGMLALLRNRAGLAHPPTDSEPQLGPVRKGVAILTLSFFVLLFMPSPWIVYLYDTPAEAPGVGSSQPQPDLTP